MNYNVPYCLDYRRPQNAEDVLKNLEKAIKEKTLSNKHYVIGFLDESSPQTAPDKIEVYH